MPTSSSPRKFLIVDDVTDSRALIVRTLLRKFPTAFIQETQESSSAVTASQEQKYDIIIAHRSVDLDGLTLVRSLRQANPVVPIIMISGVDRTPQALEAGATVFHNYDEWLRIGTVAAQILTPNVASGTATPFPGANRDPDTRPTASASP